jgi:hypothetical protein
VLVCLPSVIYSFIVWLPRFPRAERIMVSDPFSFLQPIQRT